MTTLDERYPDLLGPRTSEQQRALVATLDRLGAVTLSPARDAAIAHALHECAAARATTAARAHPWRDGRGVRPWTGRGRAMTAVMLAAALCLAGLTAAFAAWAPLTPSPLHLPALSVTTTTTSTASTVPRAAGTGTVDVGRTRQATGAGVGMAARQTLAPSRQPAAHLALVTGTPATPRGTPTPDPSSRLT